MPGDLFSRLVHSLQALPWQELGALLVRREFIAAWCAAALLYFLLCLGRLLWRVVPVRRALQRVTAPLATLDQKGFAERYEAYARTVLAEPHLEQAWREFDESLVKPIGEQEPLIRNAHDPGLYFNDATIVQPAVNARFFDTVPNQLVGLGILGTFVGLAAGVGLASADITSDDTRQVQQALAQLLSGASLAFMTSIFGLGLSLAFLWTERRLVGSVHSLLGTWVARLGRCLALVTPEQIALEQLDHARRQTRQLEVFNDQLLFTLQQALEEKVAQKLVPELEKVVQAIDALRADRAEANQAAIERLIEQFSQTLTGAAGREMAEMGATMSALGGRLEGLVGALEASQQQARDALTEAAQNVRESLAAGSAAIVAAVDRAAENMVRESRAAAGELVSGAAAAGAAIRESAAGTVAAVHRTVEDMVRELRAVAGELASGLSAAGAAIRESAAAAAQSITGALERLSEGVGQLERLNAAQAGLALRLEELGAGLGEAGATVREAHRSFAALVDQLGAAVRDTDTAASRLAASLEGTRMLVEQAAAAARAVREEHDRMAAAWQDYARRFQEIDQAVQQAFVKLGEGLQQYTDRIREFHGELDRHLGRALDSLAAATEELLGAVEELGERLPPSR